MDPRTKSTEKVASIGSAREESLREDPGTAGTTESHSQHEEAPGTETATTRTETRWEFGFFARRVTTSSTTPPGDDGGPGDLTDPK